MALANQVLARLSEENLALLQPDLEGVELAFRLSIEKPGEPIEFVVFPDNGIISVVASGPGQLEVEVGIIGHDSMTGQAVILGTDRSPNSTYVQVAGRGRRMKANLFRLALDRNPSLRGTLFAVVQSFIMQASTTALANGRANIAERLARWLLMAHDRAESNELPLTHEFLATMLGVRRAGVTIALQELEAKGFIQAQRRLIVLHDRKGLETLAKGIYGIAEAEQERLTGWKSPYKA